MNNLQKSQQKNNNRILLNLVYTYIHEPYKKIIEYINKENYKPVIGGGYVFYELKFNKYDWKIKRTICFSDKSNITSMVTVSI